jgi:hypothetical protein
MCGSSDPDPGDMLTFFFEFGDGNKTSGSSCVESHTYSASFREAAADKVKALDSTYTFNGSVVDQDLASGSRTRTVIATKPAPACGTPSVNITSPSNGACVLATVGPGTTNVPVNVTANDPGGISNVTVKGVNNFDYVGSCSGAGGGFSDTKTATGSAPNFSATLTLTNPTPASMPHCYNIAATATNPCGSAATSSVQIILAGNSCYPVISARDVKESLAWSSDLDVEGGRLQLVVNGSAALYPDAGRAYGMSAFIDGANRVEATLVDGKGKAGLWRFEFLGSQVASGSIRVIAGEAVGVAATSVTFRLKGTPGERIAFTFEKQ